MEQALLDLADEKGEAIAAERRQPFGFKPLDVADRRRALDAGAPGGRFQVGVARSRRRIADGAAAVDAVVEHIGDQVLRPQIAEGRQVEQRQKNAAVGIEHDHLPVRQCQRQAHAHPERAAQFRVLTKLTY